MPVPWTGFVGTVRMMNSFPCALWELVHVLVHLGPGHLGLGTKREGSWFSEGLFLRLSRLEALVALVEGRNLRATHCLEISIVMGIENLWYCEIPGFGQTCPSTQSRTSARPCKPTIQTSMVKTEANTATTNLLAFGRCPIADQMVEAKRKSLNEGNIFFLDVFPGNLVMLIRTRKSSMLMYLPYLLATMRSSAFLPKVGESLAARGAVRLTMTVVEMPLKSLLSENLQPAPRFRKQARVCNNISRWSLFLHKSRLIHIGESIDSSETGSIYSDLVSSLWCLRGTKA